MSKPKPKTTYARPFADHGNYISMHRLCFDVIMPSLSPNAWKCLCFVLRKTRGWGKESDPLAYSQIKEGTGIKSNTTVCKALMELRGYVKPQSEWERDFDLPDYLHAFESPSSEIGLTYALNRDVEIPVPQTAKSRAEEAKNTLFDD